MNPLIEKFGDDPRWVNWKLQTRKGKKTKVPYSVSGRLASSTDPKTWSTYAEARANSAHVGIVFTPAQNLLGIDIDHCLKDGKIIYEQDTIRSFIDEASTYTEVSPSGSGLHLFLALTSPLTLEANRKAPYELYTSGRYFTFTGDTFGKEYPVRTVTNEEARRLLSIIGYPWTNIEESAQKETPTLASTITLDDATVLERMFKSKNGREVKALFDGDISTYADDASRADMALCAHLAFWTGRNVEQIERIWLGSKLGQRKKTLQRQDYRSKTIQAAVKNCTEIYETPSMKVEAQSKKENLDLLYVVDQKGNKIFTQNTENMCRILARHSDFKGRFRYDAFKNKSEIYDKKWRLLEDNDEIEIQTKISILFPYFGKVGKDMVRDAIIKVSKDNTIDSAIEYVKNLKWDGAPRLNHWLHYTYGTPKDEYHQAVGSNWFKGMVKRIVEPGCKFDYVLVLEGIQGAKKSMSLNVLGGDWYMESTTSTETKDFFMQFAGNIIIEFSEGETMSRTEVKRMKAIITTQVDKYRPSYGRNVVEVPRRCVFAMTTNDEEYLKDDTGNRRWLPVKVELPEADVEWLATNRDQLFAEAYHRIVKLKETVYEFPKEKMKEEQDKRRVSYEHEDEIVYWYHHTLDDEKRAIGVTPTQVYKDGLGNTFGKMIGKYDQMKIAGVLRDVLKLKNQQTMINGVRTRRWVNPQKPVRSEITIDDFDL